MTDLTVMSLRAMLETAVSVGVGVATVGGFGVWLFREKIGVWVDGRIDGKVKGKLDDLEDRMGKVEESATLMAQAAKNIGETMKDGMDRMTKAFEAVGDEVKEQGKAIARIEGTMERRRSSS